MAKGLFVSAFLQKILHNRSIITRKTSLWSTQCNL